MTHEPLYSFYFLNKYNRKQKSLDGGHIDLRESENFKCNNNIFCINTGAGDYSESDFIKCRATMQRLFNKRTIYETPELEDGVYEIESLLNNNKVIDVCSASKKNGAKIQLFDRNNTIAQKFEIKYINGYYEIKSLCSSKLLDVKYSNNKITNPIIQQFVYNGKLSQKWFIIPDRRGYYYIVSACNNLFLDVKNANTTNGTDLQCFTCNATNAQKFKFIKK